MDRTTIKAMICKMSFLSDNEKIILYQRIIAQMEANGGFIQLSTTRAAVMSIVA